MSDYPRIVNEEQAIKRMTEIQDPALGDRIRLLIDSIQQFFREQPSQLRSPFDLAFFVEVLIDRMELVGTCLDGSQEAKGWWEDDEFPSPTPLSDPAVDVSRTGIRERQAYNYEATRSSRRLQAALLTLINGVDTLQRKGGRHATGLLAGQPVVPIHPEHPFDYLFMVMAVDYALRPSQPVRLLLETGSQSFHVERSSKGH